MVQAKRQPKEVPLIAIVIFQDARFIPDNRIMTRAYAKPISRRQWQIGLFAFALTVIAGAAMVLALLLGVAMPHPIGERVISPNAIYPNVGGLPAFSSLQDVPLPMTLEAIAHVTGHPEFGWGIWVWNGSALYHFRVRNDGYFDASSGWQEFMHIQPAINKLSLNIASDDWTAGFPSDYKVTLRINDEIAWHGTMQPGLKEWGAIEVTNANVTWESIKIYTG